MQVTYFGTVFIKTKFDGLDGKTKVSLQEQSGVERAFTITVDQEGMYFSGQMQAKIMSEKDLQSFAKMISDIWVEHKRLAPRVTSQGVIE